MAPGEATLAEFFTSVLSSLKCIEAIHEKAFQSEGPAGSLCAADVAADDGSRRPVASPRHRFEDLPGLSCGAHAASGARAGSDAERAHQPRLGRAAAVDFHLPRTSKQQ